MIRFECDYAEGAHPEILALLEKTNVEQTPGYGLDPYCEEAKKYIKKACENDEIDVHFLVGGTQTNLTVIASILKPHQGVIAAVSGHIYTHETGAIEACGHRIITLDSSDGKISAAQIQKVCEQHDKDVNKEHTVQPGMVFISNPTEHGTIYSKQELISIKEVCKEYGLPLYLDGARLGYGLVAEENDLTLADITELCDVYYIGGTKIGTLFGEAVIIRNEKLKKDFRYHIKQRGGMLAKGRILGIQFLQLFKNNLYFDISLHAIKQAKRIKQAFQEAGYDFLYDSPTNQLFPILPVQKVEELSKEYAFIRWEELSSEKVVVRFVTSWMTREEDVSKLIEDILKD
ncbi:threonine aldolase [Breznakia sp. PF5-3]|uniref:threonine aldolase family protein n=1 Tax=unclassified Breznakia TaxID=2623764 RepID=UPI002405A531|nr:MULTISPECIES: low specificity L-threonine aldolase [unclassified Breznakia]MDF9825061.1 threonine aldolase [Breznakia sp. PM6-1]MDF9835908.1 threonine aldolase [Breznakia sp. PF5-3]MDF9837369.1 threonine aldolase [Breznakia sp. PFB2-8]MDF9859304.1 threonine aldolase [Breznakia sp. PH5-24]